MTPDDAMTSYNIAENAHDLAGTFALVHRDATFWFSDETSHIGRDAVGAAIGRNFDLIQDESYRIDQLTWPLRTEDVAVVLYRFRWSGMVGGLPTEGEGRGTNVLVRDGEGWLIVHEHLSRGPSR